MKLKLVNRSSCELYNDNKNERNTSKNFELDLVDNETEDFAPELLSLI